MNTIAFGKSFYQVVLMLPYPLDEVRSQTDIEGIFLLLARIYTAGCLFIDTFLDSGFRRNDEFETPRLLD